MKRCDLTHYVPILRWKKAEQDALFKLDELDKTCVTPLIELVPQLFRRKGEDGKIVTLNGETAANKVSRQLFRSCGRRPFFVDLCHLSKDAIGEEPERFLTTLGAYTNTLGLAFIPVTGLTRPRQYQESVAGVAGKHGHGVCLRLTGDDINRAALQQEIESLLNVLRVTRETVDVVIDFQITDNSIPEFTHLCDLLPFGSEWRNLIVASGAFPEYLSVRGRVKPAREGQVKTSHLR